MEESLIVRKISNRKMSKALHCSVGFGTEQSASFFGEGQQVRLQVQFRHEFEKDP